MSIARENRRKFKKEGKRDKKYMSVEQSKHITAKANAIIDRGLLMHATGHDKKKKDNSGLVDKFKSIMKLKR